MKNPALIKCAMLALAIAAGGTASATGTLEGLSYYVFPNNASASVDVPTWMPDETAMVEMSSDGKTITTCDPATGEPVETIFDVANTRENSIDHFDEFKLSPDGKRILLGTDKQMIYRRSYWAQWYVYDCHSRILRPLSKEFNQQRSPLWSPDGRVVAFVTEDNNIRLCKTDYNTEVQVTTDGKVNEIINGVPDWTYEEEFSTTCSMAWSPDALTLCYIKYNEKDVPMYHFPLYEGACDPMKDYALYPGDFNYKYPVAGVVNSKVSLHCYDIETRKIKNISLPGTVEYVPRIQYGYANDRLIVTTLNRDQNRMELFNVNPRATVTKSLLVEETKTGWIEPIAYEALKLLPDGIVLASARSGWTHLYLYGYSGALERQLTSGDFDVTDYYGFDAVNNTHYFQSTRTGSINRVVSRLDAKGGIKDLTPAKGTGAMWLSPQAKYAMTSFSSVKAPAVYELINPAKGKSIRVLEDNEAVAKRYANMPRREFFTVPADSKGPELNGYVIRPKKANGPAPVVMYQYSGPGSQEVRNRWVVDWENYYAEQGYMVVCVDGRGTNCRGRDFRESVYKNLGHFETIDQLRGAEYAAKMPGADPNRIGIFGWSYGGYETLMAASAPDNPYKAAVAVAPVTDWRYYDTVYAERYMLTPQQNGEGYEASSAIPRINNLTDNLLIMHGTADDNVHLSNTMEYVSHLIAANRYCDLFLFPNMNHSINYCNGRVVVYWRMMEYFNNHL